MIDWKWILILPAAVILFIHYEVFAKGVESYADAMVRPVFMVILILIDVLILAVVGGIYWW